MAQTQVTTNKERTNMVKARIAAYLSKGKVAEQLQVDIKTVNNWEKGHTKPYLHQIPKLKEVLKFTGTDEELLQVFLVEKPQESMIADSETVNICQEENQSRQMTTTCQTTPNRAILESTDSIVIHIPGSAKGIREFMEFARRQFMEVLAHFGLAVSFGGLSLGLVSSPRVDPEEYLGLCNASIDTWWQWLSQGHFHKVERVLLENVPVLKRLANISSPFQGMAASLATQAKIMQIILATHDLDYAKREIYCGEAVRFGALSDNPLMLPLALYWQGDTYTYCYHQPKKAIRIFNDALSDLDSGASLSKSAIYSNLSIAHAQIEDETNIKENEEISLKYAVMARQVMPQYPGLDLLQQYMLGPAELIQQEGKMYLHLAEQLSSRDYAQKAYGAFRLSVSKDAINEGYLGRTLIYKADAARVLGELDDFVKHLTKGFRIAIKIDSQKRISQAVDVMGRIPPKWKQETSVQNLHKDIIHAIEVRR